MFYPNPRARTLDPMVWDHTRLRYQDPIFRSSSGSVCRAGGVIEAGYKLGSNASHRAMLKISAPYQQRRENPRAVRGITAESDRHQRILRSYRVLVTSDELRGRRNVTAAG